MLEHQLLGEILGELKALNQRVAGIEARLNSLEERTAGIEARLNSLEERTVGIEARINGLEAGQEQLRHSLIKLENEHGEKLAALCDGFKLRGDQIEELKRHLDHRLDSIALDLAYLVSKVASHEAALIKLAK